MKLQEKINRRFLSLLLIVFVASGCGLYFVLSAVIEENLDEMLKNRVETVKHSLKYTKIQLPFQSLDQTIAVEYSTFHQAGRLFSDTMVYNVREKSLIPTRKLVVYTHINGQNYRITLLLSRLESDDFAGVAFWFMLAVFALIILILFQLNYRLSVSVWKPFYSTLKRLKEFRLDGGQREHLPMTAIDEFDQLNSALETMMQKIQTDFANLKEFTENASHETQTPLAVIKSKLETILSDQTLTHIQRDQIRVAFEATIRLSKLNEALLLLSKIENRQFIAETELNLCDLIKDRLEFVEELLSLKHISVELDAETPVQVKMNCYLAEILINNLINNAIRHNGEGGQLVITSSANKIVFSNPGEPLRVGPEKLFQRFVKQSAGNESTGLGLAIVAEICKNYNISLQYLYQKGFHSFVLHLDS